MTHKHPSCLHFQLYIFTASPTAQSSSKPVIFSARLVSDHQIRQAVPGFCFPRLGKQKECLSHPLSVSKCLNRNPFNIKKQRIAKSFNSKMFKPHVFFGLCAFHHFFRPNFRTNLRMVTFYSIVLHESNQFVDPYICFRKNHPNF